VLFRGLASSDSSIAMMASISGTSMVNPMLLRFWGLTNVRMFVTPIGPKTSSRLGEESQWAVSVTSWVAITVGMRFS